MLSFNPGRDNHDYSNFDHANFPSKNLGKLRRYLNDVQKLPISYKGNRYASCAEAACGEMLRRYVPGFEVALLKTFQIPIDDPKSVDRFYTVDFGFGHLLIEYHPPRFWREGRKFGDFRTPRDYFEYRRKLDRLPEEQRDKFTEQTKSELLARYEERRRSLLANTELDGKTLLALGSPQDLYNRVIKIYGESIPSLREFVAEFDQLVDELRPQRKQRRISARRLYDQGERAAA